MKRARVSSVQEGNGSETSTEGGGNPTRTRMAAIGRKLKASAKPIRRSLRIARANNKGENEIIVENENMGEVVEVEMAVFEEEEKKQGEKTDVLEVEVEEGEESDMTEVEEEEEESEKKKILKAEEEEKNETLISIFEVAEEEEESDKTTNIMEATMKREVEEEVTKILGEEEYEKKSQVENNILEVKKINILKVEPPQEGEIMLDVDWPMYLTYEEEWLWTKKPGFTCEFNDPQDNDWRVQLWSFHDC